MDNSVQGIGFDVILLDALGSTHRAGNVSVSRLSDDNNFQTAVLSFALVQLCGGFERLIQIAGLRQGVAGAGQSHTPLDCRALTLEFHQGQGLRNRFAGCFFVLGIELVAEALQ
jgi:hypothetical protein